MYIQDFYSNLQNSNKALFYRHLINQLQPSLYPTCIRNVKYRQVLIYFRTRNHQLMVEAGSRVKPRSLPYDERLYNLCQRQDSQDEYHLVLICPVYMELRKQFIKKYYFVRPNTDKFIQLVTTNNNCILRKLAIYLHHAFILRKNLALD